MSGDGERDIAALLSDYARVERTLRRAVRAAQRRHSLLGQSIAVWRGGRVVLMTPAEVDASIGSPDPTDDDTDHTTERGA